MSKITWSDFQTATVGELKKTYKTDDRGIEKEFRKHLGGADTGEMTKQYHKFYDRRENK